MPIHDWGRGTAGTRHDFHLAWITEIRNVLNDGLLPCWKSFRRATNRHDMRSGRSLRRRSNRCTRFWTASTPCRCA